MDLSKYSTEELDDLKKKGDKYLLGYYALFFPAIAAWMLLVLSYDFSGWFLLLIIPAGASFYFLAQSQRIVKAYTSEITQRIFGFK